MGAGDEALTRRREEKEDRLISGGEISRFCVVFLFISILE
jgi:hypothetical protein